MRKKSRGSQGARPDAVQVGQEKLAYVSVGVTDQREVALNSALTAITGDRHLNYGAPEDNFGRIAHLMNSYMETRQPGAFSSDADALADTRSKPITSTDVTMLLIMVKIGRLANTPGHADSWSDIAGYAACGAGINVKE